MPYVFGLLILAATVFAVVDIILRDESEVKHLPKLVWLLLAVFLSPLGAILWFALGRRYPERTSTPRPPQFAPWAADPSAPPVPMRDARSTEQQLADLEREIEEDRLRAELRRRQRESGES